MVNGFKITEKVKKVQKATKEIDENHVFTAEEIKNMVRLIPALEEHERIQLYHIIAMNEIPHTKQQDGILMNLNDDSDPKFVFEFYTFVNKCVQNQKYREVY